MIVGLAGCQRSGKTHAAKEIAEKMDFEFVATNVASVLKEHPNAHKTFKARMSLQKAILRHLDAVLTQCEGKNVVLDRTPVDLIVYTLDAYTWKDVTDKNESVLKEYLRDCYELLKQYDFIVKTDLLDIVVEEDNKAPTGRIYMTKLDSMFDSCFNYGHVLLGGDYETRNGSIETLVNYLKQH